MLKEIASFLTGGFGVKLLDTVKGYFPPSMSDKEKTDLELVIMKATQAQEVQLLALAQSADAEFYSRIKDMEGTAAEIKGIPFIGPAIVVVRSMLRPFISIFVVLLDYQIFSGAWAWNVELKPVFVALNILVLGFWFGERMVKNVMPLFTKFMESKK